MNEYLSIVASGEYLTVAQARDAMRTIMEGTAPPEQVAGFLIGVTARGGRVDELVGFAEVMREYAVPVECEDAHAVDMCGTGGDRSGTFNVSTTAAFVVAGADVTVAKHGNRSVSSSCGSADVLEALGIKTDLRSRGIEHCLREAGMAFIFAPLFHPAMKHVMPVRRSLGVRTFFNMLGPLCNPAGVRRQLVGSFSDRAASDMATILARLGADHVITVHSADGLDEISVSDESTLFEYRTDMSSRGVLRRPFAPEHLGLRRHRLKDIHGATADQNAEILRGVLAGEDGAPRDIVLANATFAILVSGKVDSELEALEAARESIDSGCALAALERLRDASQTAPAD
jgi:anthranilate phosphoribosyltransferase